MNIRFIASAAIILSAASAFAQNRSQTANSGKSSCVDSCSNQKIPDIALCNIPPAYNVPARITGCGGDAAFTVDASYLYWCVAQEGMDIGVSGILDAGEILEGDASHVLSIPNQYTSGFRVGFGSSTTFDDWQLHLEYTYLHRTRNYVAGTIDASSLVDGDVVYSLGDWYSGLPDEDAPVIGGYVADWKLNYDLLDLSLSRPFYQGKRLIIVPYTGLLGMFVRQDFDLYAYAIDAATETSYNSYRSWAIGPEVGSNFKWLIGSGFRVEADAQFGLLYTSFYNQKHAQILLGDYTQGSYANSGYIRPFYDLSLGLGYGVYFRNSYHLDLFAGYEFVNVSQQNIMRNNAGLLNGYTSPTPDLSFHGLTVSARFDF
jgi:hypothetical protein